MADRKMFSNSVVPLLTDAGPSPYGFVVSTLTPEHRTEAMLLHFSLALPAAFDILTSWLTSQGFDITYVTPDRASVYASATVDKIEHSLGVRMVRVTRDGLTYTAANDVPSLPANIASHVQHIGGLQPFLRARKPSGASAPKGLCQA